MTQYWLGRILTLVLLGACYNAQALALRPHVIESRRCDIEFKAFSHKMAKKYNLELLVTGTGTIVDSHIANWVVSYLSHDQLSLHQVRPIITSMAKELYQLITTDPKFLNYQNLQNQDYQEPLIPKLDPDRIGIKITFWDQNMDRMKQPAIAQVIFNDKTITYFFADPQTQALVDPIVETLDLTTPNA